MITKLERILEEKTRDKDTRILYTKWCYDKEALPKALSIVSSIFPHYSLHDESHSITIINSITRILGEDKIQHLSAIDIWLILEACYWHDIGMAVPSTEIIETLKEEEFVDLFKNIKEDEKHSLYEHAQLFNYENGKFHFVDTELSLNKFDGFKFILAEYFRKKHAERSKAILSSSDPALPVKTHDEAIPIRIYKLLGDISWCHNQDFEHVLNLPFKQVGIGTEDAHPRFVASMLRIGDLLDLDNNRFSESLLSTLSVIPKDTKIHKNKHLSTKYFRADTELIEVIAQCETYDDAEAIQIWFNYIKSEIEKQKLNWTKIAPDAQLFTIPDVGELSIDLIGYEKIDGKNKPKFNLEPSRGLELLKGAGIYSSPYQSLREIIQNSIDATLLKIWLDNKDLLIDKTPQSEEFLKLTKHYEIEIYFEELKEESTGETKEWEVIIKDNGVGISRKELTYLINTGSSSKNIEKTKLIEEMPKWLMPTGIFGIGFQSIFMITDKVILRTKSYFTSEALEIELFKPDSSMDGAVLIKKIENAWKLKTGTSLSFIIKTPKIPDSWNIDWIHNLARRAIDYYDPFKDDSLDIEMGKLIDESRYYTVSSIIPTRYYYNKKIFSERSEVESIFKFYDSNTGVELSLYPIKEVRMRDSIYFRNQFVKDHYINFYFLAFEINLNGIKASDALTLNRNKFRSEYFEIIFDIIKKGILNILTQNFYNIFIDKEQQQIGSMFLVYYFEREKNVVKYKYWENYEIENSSGGGEKVKLLELKNFKTVKYRIFKNNYKAFKIYEIEEDELIINQCPTVVTDLEKDVQFFILNYIFKDYFIKKVKYLDPDEKDKEIIFSENNDHTDIYSKKELQKVIKLINNTNINYNNRLVIPCPTDFKELRIEIKEAVSYLSTYVIESDLNLQYPKMISPFVRGEKIEGSSTVRLKSEVNDKLIDWVYENRYDDETTKEDIMNGYEKFIEEYKQVMNPPVKKKKKP